MTVRELTSAEMASYALVRANLLGAVTANGHSRAYYASAVFAMRPVAAEGLGTYAVDASWRLYIDPENLPGGSAGWTVSQCGDVLEHEVNHLIREHSTRMDAVGATDRQRANIATDCEINDDLHAASFAADYGVTPTKMGWDNGLTAEEYYNKENDADDESSEGESGESGESDSEGSGEGNSEGSGEGKPELGKCGSGAGGKPIDGELAPDSATAPGVNPGEQKIAKNMVAQEVKKYESTNGRGSVPAGLARWAGEQLAPGKVPWRTVFRSVIRNAGAMRSGATDYTYTRPSRRSASTPGLILPSTFSPKPTIAVVIDTSGSMSTDMVTAAVSEVDSLSKQLGCTELPVYAVDADAATPVNYTGAASLTLKGGGGTDMRVGIEAAMKNRVKPNVVIVLTDGYTPWPDRRLNGVTLIVGIIGENNEQVCASTTQQMPWAKVVNISD
jgi:predicted metal-dependent peptidase